MIEYQDRKDFIGFYMYKKVQIKITTEYITLGQFLKLADIIQSGGEAKAFLKSNSLIVNGEDENRRGKKLRDGDEISFEGITYIIQNSWL